MNAKKKRNLAIEAALFLAIMFVTIWFVVRGEDMEAVITAIGRMSVGHLLLAVAIALFFVSAEGFLLWFLMRRTGGVSSMSSCVSCAFIGFLFSGITPSATGGQPMQLYYLKKDGNTWSLASLALMMIAFMYKLVLVLFGVGILAFWHGPLRSYLGDGYYHLFWLGLALNAMLVAGLTMVMFTPSVVRWLCAKLEWVAVRLHIIKKAGSRADRLDHFMEGYQNALSFLRKNPGNLLVLLAGTAIQRAAVFALTYVVYRGLGMSGASLWTIMWLQASVYIAVDMLPIPGAQGITEAMYRRAFRDIFSTGSVTASLCISRGISFYLMLGIGLAVTLWQFGRIRRRSARGGI